MGVNTFKCPDAASVQFKKQYYGIFDQDTLSSSPSTNVGYFKFPTLIPHFEREVNIDFVYLRGNGQNQITILFDEVTKIQFGLDENSFQSWDITNQKCLKCQNLMSVQLDKCVQSCSAGFKSVYNPKTKMKECLLIDIYLNVSYLLFAFHTNDFSGIEVDSINGLSSSQFISQYQLPGPVVSKCGQLQLYGGFFINNYKSLITYAFSAAGFNFVKIYFKYILIDFPNNINTQIQVTLNNQKQNITLTQSQLSQASDICGFEGTEVIGTFTLYSISDTQNILTILNLNTEAYLGIREVSVYAFNCLQDNCLSCTLNNSQTTCQTCATGYYLQTGVCNQCNITCYTCQDSSSCTQCLPIQGLALNQSNQCVCQEYYYFDSVNIACSACQNNKCLTCQENDSTQCLSCKPPLALLNTDCVESCGTGMAVNQTSNKCQKCIPNCMNCDNNLQSCNKCQNGFFFLNDQCITNCPDGYFGDVQNAICIPCSQPECVSCVYSIDICTKCKQSYLVDINSNKCIPTCSSNQYADQGYCKNCSQLFENCSSCDLNKCTQCMNNLLLSVDQQVCLNQCPVGTVQVSQQCVQCKANCILCDLNLTCQQCSLGFYLYQGQCNSSCLQGYYPDQYNQCQPCSNLFTNCQTCSSQQCLSCDMNSNYKYINVNKNQCVQACGIGQFLDQNNQCQLCQNNQCATCNQSNNGFCLSCDPNNSNGYIFLDKSGNCVSQCPSGYFADTNNVCQDCKQYDTNCILCNSKVCLQCNTSYCLQIDSNLQSSCQIQPNCSQNSCSTNCLMCQQGICQVCQQNYFLENGQCVSDCTVPNYYKNFQQQTCDQCSTNIRFGSDCLECNQNSCTKCITNQFIQQGKCVNACGDGYYVTLQSNICYPCNNINCLSCNPSQPNQCLTCPSQGKSLLQNGDCVSQCSSGFYLDTNQCKACTNYSSNCSICNSTICLQCNNNQALDLSSKICINTPCPSTQYLGKNYFGSDACFECSQLFVNCVQCTKDKCSQCDSQKQYLITSNNTCNDSCPDNYYPDNNKVCQQCPSSQCKTCDTSNPSACQSCFLNGSYPYLNELGKCVSQCEANEYLDAVNLKCLTCSSKFSSSCLSCQCLSQCQEGYFPDQSNICQTCKSYNSDCVQCDKKSCIACSVSSNLFLYNNQCVGTCPDFYYPSQHDIKICNKCNDDTKCKQCNLQDPSKCLSCLNSYLLNETCVTSCPYGTFPNIQDNTCTYCYSQFSSCKECTEKNCISCQDNLFILEDTQQCVSSCPFNYIDSSLIINSSPANQNPNQENKKACQKCINKNCNTCDPKDTSKCLSCSQSLENSPLIYLYNQDCLQKCDFYVNLATNECYDSCPNFLLQIEQPKQCQECPNFIQSKQCVSQCTSNTYIDQTHQKLCVVCQDQYDSNCILCNSSKCLKCSIGFYLYQNKCYSQCPSNTFFDNDNYICLDKCTDPLVIINNKQCSKNCPSGQYKEPINSQNQIICGLCDKKCKECENKSSFCTICQQGSGWDCLDNEDFDTFLKNQYCEYLKEESEIEKCGKIITESSTQTQIIDITSYLSVAICLALILGIELPKLNYN
ncbi:hypothetical protein ABPG74_020298 [Tetrahymena malaccensis]